MNSTFTWLDYSERDRRRMVDVIEALQETEARDELGIGGVRNAMADKLFPGTSTLQTRVRYFLFVPWVYRRLEGRGLSPSRMARAARQSEIQLIHALLRGGIVKCCGSGSVDHAATFFSFASTSSPFLNSAPALTNATR
ncbi:hypothetical protein BH18ACT11_BH18ACT11_27740 [soil metagenome]